MSKFIDYLNEANLGGKSRSGGVSNWEHYVQSKFDINKIFKIESECKLFDNNFNEILILHKNDEIQIISSITIKNKRSNFAEIKYKSVEGLVNITKIQKPINNLNNVIGGSHSKEFTPDKLNLSGMSFKSTYELSKITIERINSYYPEEKYAEIKKYIKNCFSQINEIDYLFESKKYNKIYKLDNNNVDDKDLKILSKNLGEILSACFILKTNKKSSMVNFPSNISQQLYDFLSINNNKTHYYSVKSLGGSSTSIKNIDFVFKYLKDNEYLKTYKHEIEVIQQIKNNKKEGKTTIKNIEMFFYKFFPNKTSKILDVLNSKTKLKINDLSQTSLDKWFSEITQTISLKEFEDIMTYIYEKILGDISTPPRTTKKALKDMYNSNDGKFYNGYLYYPLGSYITKYLNVKGEYRKVLNEILNIGSFITQIEINLRSNQMEFVVSPFKKINFKFTYNGMSKSPGNRPIGFKEC